MYVQIVSHGSATIHSDVLVEHDCTFPVSGVDGLGDVRYQVMEAFFKFGELVFSLNLCE